MQHPSIPIWKKAPFARILIPLVSGILIQYQLQVSVSFTAIAWVSTILTWILFRQLPLPIRFRYQKWQGFSILYYICLSGMLLTWAADIRHRTDWFGHSVDSFDMLDLQVAEAPSPTAKSFRTETIVQGIINNNKRYTASGKLILYTEKKNGISPFQIGDNIYIRKKPQPLTGNNNPGAFNYARYAAFKQVYHSVYLKHGEYHVEKKTQSKGIVYLINAMRESIIGILKKHFSNDSKVLGVAEALLLGYKQDLDKDLLQDYSRAGVVHIIAISGLHLGILYIIAGWILARLPFIKRKPLLQAILCAAFLWTFTLLTGAGASVLRSAVMVSTILLGKTLTRKSGIEQSLIASACILLSCNPFLLWDAGFQLSYLAVAGIVWLQKPIERCWYIPYKWLSKIWELSSVTLAATIGTLPACLYLFHQFPNYFFIANLLAVPLSTIILVMEIMLLPLSEIPMISNAIAWAIHQLIYGMNLFIEWLNGWPYAVWEQIYADIPTSLSLLMAIGFATILVHERRKKYLYGCLVSSLFFVSFHSIADFRHQDQKLIILYHAKKQVAADIIDGYSFYPIRYHTGDFEAGNDAYKSTRTAMQARQPISKHPQVRHYGNAWKIGDRSMLILDASQADSSRIPILTSPIVVLHGNPTVDMKKIKTIFQPSIIIFDPSNSLWKIAQWKESCKGLPLPCFSIPDQGAFISQWNHRPGPFK